MEPWTKSVNLGLDLDRQSGVPGPCRPPRTGRYGSFILAGVFALAASLFGQTANTEDIPVTAVAGESWIRHNHTPFGVTSMGRTWDLGPAPPVSGKESPSWRLDLSPGYATKIATLHGSDLYRLNCRACHGELGHGAPPEINSITGPVQATSTAAT